jgi:predicted transcriptional regulator
MSNYSKTSLAAYKENKELKEKQKVQIYNIITSLGGTACLKQIEHKIKLPQSTISGRIGDLRTEGKVEDTKKLVFFDGRRRKLFAICKKKKRKSKAKKANRKPRVKKEVVLDGWFS